MEASRQLPPAANVEIEQLRAQLRGEVIGPDDQGYDDARGVFFSGFDRRPTLIARVADSADVGRVVGLAGETGLELAVRSGGHSAAGHGTSEGGIVLDLSRMRRWEIDIEARAAWAETGLTAGDYTNAVAAHGLATPFGDTASVGIGGITLAGGLGFLVRKHGLTIDNLLAAEVVTADGHLVKTDADTEPDLFWAIRGGGGNFGVVTRFQYRLVEVGEIVGGMMILPATSEVITGFVAAAEAASDELSTIAAVMLAPPTLFIPAEHRGHPILMVQLVHAAGGEAAARALDPFRTLAERLVDTVRPMRYPEMFAMEGPRPVHSVTRNMFVDEIDAGAAETILERLPEATAPMAATQLRILGGAVDAVPMDSTAYAHRGRRIMVNVGAMFMQAGERPQHESWASDLAAELRDSGPGAYTGFIGDEGPDRIHEAYPETTWNRLRRVKAQYDPYNLFRLNQNVPPA